MGEQTCSYRGLDCVSLPRRNASPFIPRKNHGGEGSSINKKEASVWFDQSGWTADGTMVNVGSHPEAAHKPRKTEERRVEYAADQAALWSCVVGSMFW